VTAACLLCSGAQATPAQGVDAEDVLGLAEDTGKWLAATATHGPDGISWPNDILNPETVGYDLASGVAGKVVFFAALHKATGNSDYLDLATGGADYLLSVLDDSTSFDGNTRRASLYSGISGIGVALLQVQQHDRKYQEAVAQIVDRLQAWSVETPAGVMWSDEFNDLIYGDAGTALFLGHVAEQTGNIQARNMAANGARFLLGQGQEAEQGTYWLFRRSKPFNLPNYSHGTAGIAYVLATVGLLVDDESLLDGASQGFAYIRSIAEVEEGLLRIPYGWGSDSWDGLYEFGWAHGLAGTANLFRRLQQTGVDTGAAAEFEQLTRHTILNIGLPGTADEPFAEPSTPLDQRFGRAGVLAALAGWSETATLRDSIIVLLETAAVRDETGTYWQVDAPAFMGGGRAAYTGLFHGAAGIGLALLSAHSAMSGNDPYVQLPDDPGLRYSVAVSATVQIAGAE
jgi:lantibiotic modifying enzyme